MSFWSQEQKPIHTEAQLKDRVNNDNYAITRVFKFSACFLLVGVAVVIAVGFVIQYIMNPETYDLVNEKVLENLSGLIFSGLTIAGVSYNLKHSG